MIVSHKAAIKSIGAAFPDMSYVRSQFFPRITVPSGNFMLLKQEQMYAARKHKQINGR